MSPDLEQRLVSELKQYVTENLPLSKISDEELEERVEDIVEQRLAGQYCSIEQRLSIVRQIYSSIRGFGLLDSIISDDTITEVMINGPEHIFIEQNGRLFKLDKQFESQRRLEDVIQRIVGLAGREVNQANPNCDTRLPDGSRVNVVLPPIALCGPVLTIRKFSKTPMTIEKLISYGSITQEIADKLELLVRAKYNIFISGGTGSGKTTFLNALSNYIPKDERVITIEDSAELQIEGVENLVSLETRNANASGAGQITIRDLIKSSLRMRPERIIVGEVRGGEALDMLQAMNTGHDGSLSTGTIILIGVIYSMFVSSVLSLVITFAPDKVQSITFWTMGSLAGRGYLHVLVLLGALVVFGGVLFGKLMYIFTKGKVNPLIGSAGVSAVPMAARVSQKEGQRENPSNFLLMHAMGPNVSGVIGSAVAAGIMLTLLK